MSPVAIALVVGLVMTATCAGVVLGAVMAANARADLEAENADLRRRLLARDAYEEHA